MGSEDLFKKRKPEGSKISREESVFANLTTEYLLFVKVNRQSLCILKALNRSMT